MGRDEVGEVSQGHIRGAHVRVLETEEKCLHLSSIYCVPSVCVTRVPLQRPGGVGILIVDLLQSPCTQPPEWF